MKWEECHWRKLDSGMVPGHRVFYNSLGIQCDSGRILNDFSWLEDIFIV